MNERTIEIPSNSLRLSLQSQDRSISLSNSFNGIVSLEVSKYILYELGRQYIESRFSGYKDLDRDRINQMLNSSDREARDLAMGILKEKDEKGMRMIDALIREDVYSIMQILSEWDGNLLLPNIKFI